MTMIQTRTHAAGCAGCASGYHDRRYWYVDPHAIFSHLQAIGADLRDRPAAARLLDAMTTLRGR